MSPYSLRYTNFSRVQVQSKARDTQRTVEPWKKETKNLTDLLPLTDLSQLQQTSVGHENLGCRRAGELFPKFFEQSSSCSTCWIIRPIPYPTKKSQKWGRTFVSVVRKKKIFQEILSHYRRLEGKGKALFDISVSFQIRGRLYSMTSFQGSKGLETVVLLWHKQLSLVKIILYILDRRDKIRTLITKIFK